MSSPPQKLPAHALRAFPPTLLEGRRGRERASAWAAPRRFGLAASLCALLCAGSPSVAWAQSVNLSKLVPAGADRSAPGTSKPRLEPGAARLQTPKGAEKKFVFVRRVSVTNGFPELDQKTRELVAQIEGQRVSLARIYEVARAVRQAYIDAQYPLAQVVVKSEGHDGVVHLDIIDAFIERIDVSKAPQDVRELLLERLRPLLGLKHATLDEIQRRILLAGRLPGLSFNFSQLPGLRPDGVVLELEATERVIQGTSSVDNRLSKWLGTWEFWKSVRVNNVLGFGEQFFGSVASSPDIGEVWSGNAKFQFYGGGVSVPIGADGLSATAGYLQVRTRQDPVPYTFGWVYTAAGERIPQLFERTYARLNYPFVLNLRQELWLQASYEHINQIARDNPYPAAIWWPGVATYDLARDHYDALRLHGDWGFFLPSPSDAKVMVSAEYSKGVDGRFPDSDFLNGILGGIPMTRPFATPLFSRLSAFGRVFQSLPENFQFSLFLRGQTNFGLSLPQAEQMSLDATDIAVSGFASGSVNVDRGYTARGEFSRPMGELKVESLSAYPTPYVFAATGRGALQVTYVGESKYIAVTSLGGGLRMGVNVTGVPLDSSLGVEVAKDYSSNYYLHPGGYRTNFSYAVHF